MKKLILIITILCFIASSIQAPAFASGYTIEGTGNIAQEFRLPAPGVMVHLSPEFNPPILKGIKVHPDNPLRFDFILDQGDFPASLEAQKTQATRLVKYFLASLTIPEKDLWVNLSPYEKNRIIPQSFGLTEMGRDLLAEDYMLKQITASLIYPEDEIGRKFWKRIYEEAYKKFGTTNIPVNTFNKVWIVPEKAVVYENANAGTAYVVESSLKVMLEQDYLALAHSVLPVKARASTKKDINALGSQIVREIVIPELTREVNENKSFVQLRQVYNSLILATWYKKKIKDSILSQVYDDKKKVAGVGFKNSLNVDVIYQRYLQAFKKGVYNYIKEDIDPATQAAVPRKYFSGGVNDTTLSLAMTTVDHVDADELGQNKQPLRIAIDLAVDPGDGLAGRQLVEQRDSTKYRTLQDYDTSLEIWGADFRVGSYLRRRGPQHTVWADMGFGLGAALFDGVSKYPHVEGIGVDAVDWNENTVTPKEMGLLRGMYTESKLERLFAKKDITFIQGDMTKVVLPKHPDLVTALFSLEYVDDPLNAFIHFFNQLNDGGVIVAHFLVPSDEEQLLSVYQKFYEDLKQKVQVKMFSVEAFTESARSIVFIAHKSPGQRIVSNLQLISASSREFQTSAIRRKFNIRVPHYQEAPAYLSVVNRAMITATQTARIVPEWYKPGAIIQHPFPNGLADIPYIDQSKPNDGSVRSMLEDIKGIEKKHGWPAGTIVVTGGSVRRLLVGKSEMMHSDMDILIGLEGDDFEQHRTGNEILRELSSFLGTNNGYMDINRQHTWQWNGMVLDYIGHYNRHDISHHSALFVDPYEVEPISYMWLDSNGVLYDLYGGVQDLLIDKKFRLVGLREDWRNFTQPTDILRAVRFKFEFGLSFDETTENIAENIFNSQDHYERNRQFWNWFRIAQFYYNMLQSGKVDPRVIRSYQHHIPWAPRAQSMIDVELNRISATGDISLANDFFRGPLFAPALKKLTSDIILDASDYTAALNAIAYLSSIGFDKVARVAGIDFNELLKLRPDHPSKIMTSPTLADVETMLKEQGLRGISDRFKDDGVYLDAAIEDHQTKPKGSGEWGVKDNEISVLGNGQFIRFGEYAIVDNSLRDRIPEHLRDKVLFLRDIVNGQFAYNHGLEYSLPYLAQIYKARRSFKDAGVLEFGIGQGIAALFAIKLGAKQVVGIEKEPRFKDDILKEMQLNGIDGGKIVFVDGKFSDADMVDKVGTYGPFKFGMGNIGPHYEGSDVSAGLNRSNMEALELVDRLHQKQLLTAAFEYIAAGFRSGSIRDIQHFVPGEEIRFLAGSFRITGIHTAIYRRNYIVSSSSGRGVGSRALGLYSSYHVTLSAKNGAQDPDVSRYLGEGGTILLPKQDLAMSDNSQLSVEDGILVDAAENQHLRAAAAQSRSRLQAANSWWSRYWMKTAEVPRHEAERYPGTSRIDLNYYLNFINAREVILDGMLEAIENHIGLIQYKEFLNTLHRIQLIGREENRAYISNYAGLLGWKPKMLIEKTKSGEMDMHRDYYAGPVFMRSYLGFMAFFKLGPEASANEVLVAVADYFYQSMKTNAFGDGRVNNSVFMNIVNAMLRVRGFNGIKHDILDIKSRRKDFGHVYLRDFWNLVRDSNPGIDFGDPPFSFESKAMVGAVSDRRTMRDEILLTEMESYFDAGLVPLPQFDELGTTFFFEDIFFKSKFPENVSIDESKRIKRKTRDDFTLSAQLSLDGSKGISDHVEGPARGLVDKILKFGGKPLWSNAYGPYPNGVIWQFKRNKYFTSLDSEDYDAYEEKERELNVGIKVRVIQYLRSRFGGKLKAGAAVMDRQGQSDDRAMALRPVVEAGIRPGDFLSRHVVDAIKDRIPGIKIKTEEIFYDSDSKKPLEKDEQQRVFTFSGTEHQELFSLNIKLKGHDINLFTLSFPKDRKESLGLALAPFQWNSEDFITIVLLAVQGFVTRDSEKNGIETFETLERITGAAKFFKEYFEKHGASFHLIMMRNKPAFRAELNPAFWASLKAAQDLLPRSGGESEAMISLLESKLGQILEETPEARQYPDAEQWFLPYVQAGFSEQGLSRVVQRAFDKPPSRWIAPFVFEDKQKEAISGGIDAVVKRQGHELVITGFGAGDENAEPLHLLSLALEKLRHTPHEIHHITIRYYDNDVPVLENMTRDLPAQLESMFLRGFQSWRGKVKVEIFYGDIFDMALQNGSYSKVLSPSNITVLRNTWVLVDGLNVDRFLSFVNVLRKRIRVGGLIVRESHAPHSAVEINEVIRSNDAMIAPQDEDSLMWAQFTQSIQPDHTKNKLNDRDLIEASQILSKRISAIRYYHFRDSRINRHIINLIMRGHEQRALEWIHEFETFQNDPFSESRLELLFQRMLALAHQGQNEAAMKELSDWKQRLTGLQNAEQVEKNCLSYYRVAIQFMHDKTKTGYNNAREFAKPIMGYEPVGLYGHIRMAGIYHDLGLYGKAKDQLDIYYSKPEADQNDQDVRGLYDEVVKDIDKWGPDHNSGADDAQIALPKGGIDLTPAKMNVEVKNGVPAGTALGGIKFHLDPAMLAQLQNAPGFVPVIISVEPEADLRGFLMGK